MELGRKRGRKTRKNRWVGRNREQRLEGKGGGQERGVTRVNHPLEETDRTTADQPTEQTQL